MLPQGTFPSSVFYIRVQRTAVCLLVSVYVYEDLYIRELYMIIRMRTLLPINYFVVRTGIISHVHILLLYS